MDGSRQCAPAPKYGLNPQEDKVEKRSLKRAYKRAIAQGFAWYRGKCYSRAALEQMGCQLPVPKCKTQTLADGLYHDWHTCNQRHSSKRRLTIWQWNSGGLSAHRLDEVKAWLHLNCVQIAVLVETRWSFDAEWQDPQWHLLHSGAGPGRGKGILVMISKSVCPHSHISWQKHASGRLVHVRLQLMPRPIDLIACYQHTYQPSKSCLRQRELWWNLLEHVLHGIPNRHNLVLLGDLNTCLMESPGVSGTGTFHWQGTQTTGTVHVDHARWAHILRNHALVALNAWESTLGPTYVHGDQASRLDYFCVRQMFADAEARAVQYLWSSPFLDQTSHGHVPMLCTIARYWIPVFNQAKAIRINQRQRQISRDAFVHQSSEWLRLTHDTQHQLLTLFESPELNANQFIELMHSTTMQTFCQHFPSGKVPRHPPDWQPALQTIHTKWDHRRALQKPKLCTLRNILQVWFHAARFQFLKRLHRSQAKLIRKARFQEVVQQAAEAAAQHNTHRLFHVINQFAPKQPKRQIQLRNQQGHMATPVESAALLNQFVAESWRGPNRNGLEFEHAPGVPFTVHQLEQALAMIPATKATAKPCVPGVLWKQHANFLAPLLYAKLELWWQHNPPCIPDAWRNGWLS